MTAKSVSRPLIRAAGTGAKRAEVAGEKLSGRTRSPRPQAGLGGEFCILTWGLVYASICTSLPIGEATARLNRELPTGLSSEWAQSKDKTFSGGQSNPCPCESYPANQHYLMSC